MQAGQTLEAMVKYIRVQKGKWCYTIKIIINYNVTIGAPKLTMKSKDF